MTQENQVAHATIPEMVESPNEGQFIDGHSIMTSEVNSPKGQIKQHAREETHSQKMVIKPNNEVEFNTINGKRSAGLTKRPIHKNKIAKKVRRSFSKGNDPSKIFINCYQTNKIIFKLVLERSNFSSIQAYIPDNEKRNREMSLPDIKRNKINNSSNRSSYSINNKNYSIDKNLMNVPKHGIGNSFMSFNMNNSSNQNNSRAQKQGLAFNLVNKLV